MLQSNLPITGASRIALFCIPRGTVALGGVLSKLPLNRQRRSEVVVYHSKSLDDGWCSLLLRFTIFTSFFARLKENVCCFSPVDIPDWRKLEVEMKASHAHATNQSRDVEVRDAIVATVAADHEQLVEATCGGIIVKSPLRRRWRCMQVQESGLPLSAPRLPAPAV